MPIEYLLNCLITARLNDRFSFLTLAQFLFFHVAIIISFSPRHFITVSSGFGFQ